MVVLDCRELLLMMLILLVHLVSQVRLFLAHLIDGSLFLSQLSLHRILLGLHLLILQHLLPVLFFFLSHLIFQHFYLIILNRDLLFLLSFFQRDLLPHLVESLVQYTHRLGDRLLLVHLLDDQTLACNILGEQFATFAFDDLAEVSDEKLVI